jgi:hypothetical protein
MVMSSQNFPGWTLPFTIHALRCCGELHGQATISVELVIPLLELHDLIFSAVAHRTQSWCNFVPQVQ